VAISERARVIKSADEIACMRWATAVAEHAIARVRQTIEPGVKEVQLWALLNYTNIANNGDWHDGRMLASGPRINPWCQEASERRLEPGDLVGLDTDMIGPFGYFADVSRTFHCGPSGPTARQKQLYRLARDEIEHNLRLVRPGISLTQFQEKAFAVPEAFHQNAYPCVIHGVGMCDEYPRVNPIFRGATPYDGELAAGMVICVESYMGAVGERDGVKLEQQVLVTEDGYEMLTTYPLEEALLDFPGCAVVISHDRWFLDRIATHILAFEGDSQVVWFEGNYADYETDRKRRLGADADQPHRIKYKRLDS